MAIKETAQFRAEDEDQHGTWQSVVISKAFPSIGRPLLTSQGTAIMQCTDRTNTHKYTNRTQDGRGSARQGGDQLS